MLNFVLCDDNENILSKLEKMLEAIFIRNNLPGQVSFTTTEPDELIKYTNINPFDVLILDIDLKSEISGLDLAQKIRSKNKKSYIIFSTAHLEYLMVAYKYKTFDFLAKPITIERLSETVLRLFNDVSNVNTTFFKINNKEGHINSNSIYFIQKQGKKAIVKTEIGDYELTSSFSDILNRLPENFVRCHKSFIVNVNKVSEIKSDNIIIFKDNNKIQCQIGPKYENLFLGG